MKIALISLVLMIASVGAMAKTVNCSNPGGIILDTVKITNGSKIEVYFGDETKKSYDASLISKNLYRGVGGNSYSSGGEITDSIMLLVQAQESAIAINGSTFNLRCK